MKKLRTKAVIGALSFALVIGLFGTPTALGTSVIPTVGGFAAAYAPCSYEHMVMQAAWDDYNQYGGFWALMDYLNAARDYYSCMSG